MSVTAHTQQRHADSVAASADVGATCAAASAAFAADGLVMPA